MEPVGQYGVGNYGSNITCTKDSLDYLIQVSLDAIAKVPYDPAEGPFVICEFGSNDGWVSERLVGKCIDYLKARYGEDTEISIVYEDIPQNDFMSLFLRFEGEIGDATFLNRHQGIYVTTCGRSFYKQCMPTSSVHFAFTQGAMHFLSKRPCTSRTDVFYNADEIDVEYGFSEEEKTQFSRQVEVDWMSVLELRSKELVPGGRFVFSNYMGDLDGAIPVDSNHTDAVEVNKTDAYKTGCGLLGNLTRFWRQMADDGVISKREFENTTAQCAYPTERQLTNPFYEPTSLAYRTGMRIEHFNKQTIECSIRKRYLQAKQSGVDLTAEAAKAYVGTVKCWTHATFKNGLSSDRSLKEKLQLVDRLYQMLEEHILQNGPQNFIKDANMGIGHVVKIQNIPELE